MVGWRVGLEPVTVMGVTSSMPVVPARGRDLAHGKGQHGGHDRALHMWDATFVGCGFAVDAVEVVVA